MSVATDRNSQPRNAVKLIAALSTRPLVAAMCRHTIGRRSGNLSILTGRFSVTVADTLWLLTIITTLHQRGTDT
jgi:hypothetical protein